MNIRSLMTSLLLLALVQISSALDAPARIYFKDGTQIDVLMSKYEDGFATYKSKKRDTKPTRKDIGTIQSIYFKEVPLFKEANQLYQTRKYTAARTKYRECQEAYKALDSAPNNYSSLAGFYALECSRRLFDLETLSADIKNFRKEGLTRETHLQQLEVNAFWEAVRQEDWARVDSLAQEWHTRKVPGTHRAQIAYCHGLAYEKLGQKEAGLITKALNAYNLALTADSAASQEIVVEAISKCLKIYENDAGVKLARKNWKSPLENQDSKGYGRLVEANALARFYMQSGFSAVKELRKKEKAFLKYSPPQVKEVAPESGKEMKGKKEEAVK